MKPSRVSVVAVALSMIGVVVAVTTVEAQRQRGIPRFKEEIQVTPDAEQNLMGAGNDHFMSFSAPVSLPGVSLAPGTQIFSVESSRTLRVRSVDRESHYAWVNTMPVERAKANNTYEVWFGDRAMKDSPRPIIAWFIPGQRGGYELVYPQHAQQFTPVSTIAAH